jgi:hypothetical protein
MPNVIPAAPIDAYPVVIAGPTGPTGPSGMAARELTQADIITALQAKVADLQARISALENR